MNYPAGTGTRYLDTGSMIANFFCLLCCCMNKKLILIINLLYSKFTWNVLTIWRSVAGLANVQNDRSLSGRNIRYLVPFWQDPESSIQYCILHSAPSSINFLIT